MQQLTPNNAPKLNFYDPATVGDCWIAVSDFPNLMSYNSDPSKQPYLNNAIINACAFINKICNRKFNKQKAQEIFMNETLAFRDYKVYTLRNRPLISVSNVWLNITNTFSPIDLNFLQVLTEEGIIKILPTFSVYVQTTLPFYAYQTASNLWVEYTSGYDKADVPMPIKLATAMYVDYLYSRFSLVGGVSNFSTQTYSQGNITKAGEDPILVSINDLIEPYIIYMTK